jgi:ketosteroid isomerase-like protein
MRTVTTFLALLFATTAYAAVPTPAEEKEVLAAMNAFAEAVAKHDVAALQRVLHDELVYSHSDTRAQTKADLIKEAQEGRGPGGIALAEPKVHIYGNTAIIRGRVGGGARGVQANSPHAVAVYVKGPTGWQVIARTATRPPDPAGARSGGARSAGPGAVQ